MRRSFENYDTLVYRRLGTNDLADIYGDFFEPVGTRSKKGLRRGDETRNKGSRTVAWADGAMVARRQKAKTKKDYLKIT